MATYSRRDGKMMAARVERLMQSTRNGPMQAGGKAADLGLLATGSCGGWRIDVDEATSGPDRWFLQVEGPSAYFYFEIPSPGVIAEIDRFLISRPPAGGRPTGSDARSDWELAIGVDPQSPVLLLRDDEFDDRFFLRVGCADSLCVRFTLQGEDVKCVATALEQVREDLPAD